jgi:hypothetical protein
MFDEVQALVIEEDIKIKKIVGTADTPQDNMEQGQNVMKTTEITRRIRKVNRTYNCFLMVFNQ